MRIEDLRVGDWVYVYAPHRNLLDRTLMAGEAEVVGVYPNHAMGPCLDVRDHLGKQMVLYAHTLPLWMQIYRAAKGPRR